MLIRDGLLLGAVRISGQSAPYGRRGSWKGHLTTSQHTPFADPFVRPLFGGHEVTSGFSGTFADDSAEAFGTVLVGTRSLSFRATLNWLADA